MTEASATLHVFVDCLDRHDEKCLYALAHKDIVVHTMHGVLQGRDVVVPYLVNLKRFDGYRRSFDQWKHVHHCLDPLPAFNPTVTQAMTQIEQKAFGGRLKGGNQEVSRFFDDLGYDAQGFAQFERIGWFGNADYIPSAYLKMRQTLVLKAGLVVLWDMSQRR